MTNNGGLIIFSKAPVPGNVKTRLIPDISYEKAASIYKKLLTKTLDTAIKANFASIQLWVDGDIDHPFFKSCNEAITLYQQSGEGLGQRMSHAMDTVLASYPLAVLIGSDCPTLTVTDLNAAGEALLRGKNVVLGPTEDGGYYLIGLRKKNPRLFEMIPWGTATVFAKTCQRIKDLNWQLSLLPERWDLDRPDDLARYFEL